MDLSQFAGPERPLRPSSLAWLARCRVQAVLRWLDELTDSAGPAAETGSLVHAAVAAFHLEPNKAEKVSAAFAGLQTSAGSFPLADPAEARLYLTPYIADPRNQDAEVVAVERSVSLVLDPHRLDPTGLPVHIRGTVDQIRRLPDGRVVNDDLKTGGSNTQPWVLLHDYAYQIAAYCLAARESGFPDCTPGRMIYAYGYRKKGVKLPAPDGVFWEAPFDLDGARLLMDRLRLEVALIRAGEVDFGPGLHCGYCPAKGLDTCVPLAGRKLFSLPVLPV